MVFLVFSAVHGTCSHAACCMLCALVEQVDCRANIRVGQRSFEFLGVLVNDQITIEVASLSSCMSIFRCTVVLNMQAEAVGAAVMNTALRLDLPCIRIDKWCREPRSTMIDVSLRYKLSSMTVVHPLVTTYVSFKYMTVTYIQMLCLLGAKYTVNNCHCWYIELPQSSMFDRLGCRKRVRAYSARARADLVASRILCVCMH